MHNSPIGVKSGRQGRRYSPKILSMVYYRKISQHITFVIVYIVEIHRNGVFRISDASSKMFSVRTSRAIWESLQRISALTLLGSPLGGPSQQISGPERTPKALHTPATMSKQHCRMLQIERFYRQSRTLFDIVAIFGKMSNEFFVKFRHFDNVETN